ncbi:MAG TPA: TMEM175 family protein [Terriglobales bacterium]|nr:TMEM175 family protein [Terriglobales bacterium]
MQHGEMTTSRLEAFSDGVIAVIVTIMVLEMRRGPGSSTADTASAVGPSPASRDPRWRRRACSWRVRSPA